VNGELGMVNGESYLTSRNAFFAGWVEDERSATKNLVVLMTFQDQDDFMTNSPPAIVMVAALVSGH